MDKTLGLSGGEVLVIGELAKGAKVSRTTARLVMALDEKLSFKRGVLPGSLEVPSVYVLTDLEVTWVAELLDRAFEAEGVPGFMASWALSLDDKLKEALK